jgi:hypothetical protein
MSNRFLGNELIINIENIVISINWVYYRIKPIVLVYLYQRHTSCPQMATAIKEKVKSMVVISRDARVLRSIGVIL